MKLKGFIFDLDGTLGDTFPVFFEAFRKAFDEFLGRRFTEREIIALFGPTEEGIIKRLVPDRWRDCLQTYLDEYERAHARFPDPFPGIENALILLRKRGVSLAIVTGKGPRSTAVSLGYFGFAHYFDVVETGSADGPVKPCLIRKVVERWGASPTQVAYIGDMASDIEAAKEAGVIPLGAAWASTSDLNTLDETGALKTFGAVESFIKWIEDNIQDKRKEEA